MYSSLSAPFLKDIFGKFIKLLRFAGVNHTETPGHNELQEGKYPGPGNASDEWFIQNFGVGCHDGQCKIETEEKECKGNDEFFLCSKQFSEGRRISDLRIICGRALR